LGFQEYQKFAKVMTNFYDSILIDEMKSYDKLHFAQEANPHTTF